jgi:putative endonuclease
MSRGTPHRERRRVGTHYEDLAAGYLEEKGYRILDRNFHARRGELDLIALDGETVVFVEVRMRRQNDMVSPLESVTPEKQRRIVLAARTYLAKKQIVDRDCRFDVIAILHRPGCRPEIDHYESAFFPEAD